MFRTPLLPELTINQMLLEAKAAERLNEWQEAACIYLEAISSGVASPDVLVRAANALWLSDQPEEALGLYQRASLLEPLSAAGFMGLGNCLRDLNRFEAADRAFRASRELRDSAEVACNHAALLIGLEAYADAFALAERRHELDGRDPALHPDPAALLTTTPVLRVRSEQGFGDALQYLRWIPPLQQQAGARGQSVLLEVEPAMVSLVEKGLAWLPSPVAVRSLAEPSEPAGAVSLLSLPALLGGAPCPQPPAAEGGGGYLRGLGAVDLGASDRRPPLVGLTWASGRKLEGGFTRREYRKRSLPGWALQRLVEGMVARGCQPVPLQHGDDRELAQPLQHLFRRQDAADGDFLAAARVLAGTDLLISVDTAMAHLAGAMGHPAWVLLPFSADPRWLRDRPDIPWYPSLRLFRQGCDRDWGRVVDTVLEALGLWMRRRRSDRR